MVLVVKIKKNWEKNKWNEDQVLLSEWLSKVAFLWKSWEPLSDGIKCPSYYPWYLRSVLRIVQKFEGVRATQVATGLIRLIWAGTLWFTLILSSIVSFGAPGICQFPAQVLKSKKWAHLLWCSTNVGPLHLGPQCYVSLTLVVQFMYLSQWLCSLCISHTGCAV